MSDNDVSIPPLRTGVVFAEWAPVVRDKLKAAKHGIIFRMPDPRKRPRFTGSSQCAQENHPLINTVPPKETVSEYADLCEKWAAASQSAAAKIRLALSKDTCKGANLLSDQDDYFALMEWLDEQNEDEKAGVTLRDFTQFKYEGGTSIQEHNTAVLRLGERFWFGHLGVSLDRDLASPGLLGVRWDGPAGGTTFRDPVAEPRPGSRSRAYVCGPSAGGWPKVALVIQVGPQYDSYGDRPGRRGPVQWKKKMEGDPSSYRSVVHQNRLIG